MEHTNRTHLLGDTVAVVILLAAGLTTSAGAKNTRPVIKKLGTLDLLVVEATPVVFKDRLYRFEYVRDNYHANKTGASYFRFIDVGTGKATPAFAKGQHLGCAFVEGDTVYAFGVNKWGGSKITLFRSKDMETWDFRFARDGDGFREWGRMWVDWRDEHRRTSLAACGSRC